MLRLNFKRKKRNNAFLVGVLFVLIFGFIATIYFYYGDIIGQKITPKKEVKTYFLRGILIQGKERYAIFLDNRGRRYMVKEGMETDNFRIKKIDSTGVTLLDKNGKEVNIKW